MKRPTVAIEKLEDIDEQDVKVWVKKFRNIVKLAQMEEETGSASFY